MKGSIAVINAGSSSIKFALHGADDKLALLYRGQIEKISHNSTAIARIVINAHAG